MHVGADHLVAIRIVQVLQENGYSAEIEHRKPGQAFAETLGDEYYLLETNADLRIAEGLLLLFTRQEYGDEGLKRLRGI